MKILIVMGGFFPGKKFGGPPVSVDNFCSLLKDEATCYIVTHNHDMGDNTPFADISDGWNDRGNAKVMYLSDDEYKYATFECIAEELQPDCIYLQGLFQSCVLPCLKLATKLKIKVILAPRGEICAGAFKKKYKKIPYIIYLRMMGLLDSTIFQATSKEEFDAIKKYLGASFDRIYLLNNIPSVPSDLPEYGYKETGCGKFVFISRILWKKNLLEAISYFKNIRGNVVFDIYGPKEDEAYWHQCEAEIKLLPRNIKVAYKGVLNHDEIHKTFRGYDAFLFPTLSENYGHVIAEALASGCSPIISNQTPWNDLNDNGAGWALPLDKPNLFVQAIQDIVDMDNESIGGKRGNIECYLKSKLQIKQIKADYLSVFR